MKKEPNDSFIDNDGYPTEELLSTIRNYEPHKMPILDMVRIITDCWYHGDYGYRLGRKYRGVQKLELHTLGWSGNELIMREILANVWLTGFEMDYRAWKTGGHYYFNIKSPDSTETITYGYTTWNKKCPSCHKLTMQVVRDGKAQCSNCG